MTGGLHSQAPSIQDIEAMARDIQQSLPARFRDHLGEIVLRIENFPTRDVMDAMELASPYDILGLYHGVDIGHKSVSDSGALPDMIYLYRRPILDYWRHSGEELRSIVAHVLVHEIGHHFGLSDDDMAAIEAQTHDGEVPGAGG